jgi:hypothetical protein
VPVVEGLIARAQDPRCGGQHDTGGHLVSRSPACLVACDSRCRRHQRGAKGTGAAEALGRVKQDRAHPNHHGPSSFAICLGTSSRSSRIGAAVNVVRADGQASAVASVRQRSRKSFPRRVTQSPWVCPEPPPLRGGVWTSLTVEATRTWTDSLGAIVVAVERKLACRGALGEARRGIARTAGWVHHGARGHGRRAHAGVSCR